MRKLAVSIINYRTAELTCACLESVLADLRETDSEVIIIDNASGDGSTEYIKAWLETAAPDMPVQLVLSGQNSGFSGGHNQGMSTVDAEYYLVLNSDALIKPDFFQELLAVAEKAPDAGFITPTIVGSTDEPERSLFRFHTPVSELLRGAQTGPLSKIFRKYIVPIEDPINHGDVDWVSFACVLLNGEMVRSIGPMDEGYFLYFEDCEYCLRGKRAGWAIAHAPKAKVLHYEGGSGSLVEDAKERRRLPKYYYASRTRFLYQAHGWFGLLAANLFWYVGRIFANARRLFGKSVPPAAESEHLDLWTNTTKPLGPRYAPWEST